HDFGGREVEANIIATSLEKLHNVKIVSTDYMSEKSFALQNLVNTSWTSIPLSILKNNILISFLTALSKFRNNKKTSHTTIKNSLSKRFYDFDKLYVRELNSELHKNVNIVILLVQLSTKYLNEIIEICNE